MRSWWTAWLQATRPPSSPLPSGGENGLAPALGTGQRGRPTRKAHEEGANAPPARRRVRPGGRTPRTLPAPPARTACGGCFASFLTRRPYLLGPRSGHESGAGVARLPWWPVPGCDPPRTRSPTARTGGGIVHSWELHPWEPRTAPRFLPAQLRNWPLPNSASQWEPKALLRHGSRANPGHGGVGSQAQKGN